MHHTPVDPGPPPTSLGPKPWWKVSYFWVIVFVNLSAVTASAVESELVPPKYVMFVATLSAGFYGIARGIVGMGKAMANANMTTMLQTAETVAAQTAEVVVAETVKPEAKK